MISREEVEGLAKLARLELSDAEIVSLQHDISGILEYVGQISAVTFDAEKGVPLVHNVMRDDAPREASDQLAGKEAALVAALPTSKDGYNVVRKIIQKDE